MNFVDKPIIDCMIDTPESTFRNKIHLSALTFLPPFVTARVEWQICPVFVGKMHSKNDPHFPFMDRCLLKRRVGL